MSTTDAESELHDSCVALIERHRLDPRAHWIVACSGGRDSSVLAATVAGVVRERGGSVSVAYIDHGLRAADERSEERACVERLSALFGLPLDCSSVEPGRIASDAEARGESLEAVARHVRYGMLSRIAVRRRARFVVTGHHLHDQLETVLMRLARGTGARGLSGIPEIRPLIHGATPDGGVVLVRPFLEVCPSRIAEAARMLASRCDRPLFWEDSSNRSARFLRNRFRHEVTPSLLAVEPAAAHGVSLSARRMRETEEALRFAAGAALGASTDLGHAAAAAASAAGSAVHIDAVTFAAFPRALRTTCCFLALERLLGSDSADAVPARFFRALGEWDGNGAVLLRGYGVRVSWTPDDGAANIVLTRDVVRTGKKGYLVCAGRNSSSSRCHTAVIEVCDRYGWSVLVSADRVSPPLLLRSRRPGDRLLQPYGHKELKKLVAERGGRVRVLEDRDGILGALFSPWGGTDLFRPGVRRIDPDDAISGGTGERFKIVVQGDTGIELATE